MAQPKPQTRVYISSSSYFSNGITSQEKKIGYVKNDKGERGILVQYKNEAPIKRVDDVEVVKSMLGLPVQPRRKAAKPLQKRSKGAKALPEHKKQKPRKASK